MATKRSLFYEKLEKMGNYVTLAVAISTCFIGAITCFIAYSQMKIASAKVKLDLYERRFNVYISALNCLWACYTDQIEKILEAQFKLIESCGESQFLFKKDSGIHEVLKDMKSNCDIVCKCQKSIEKIKENSKNENSDVELCKKQILECFDKANKARKNYSANLIDLEVKIKPYIQFETITGWRFF